MKTRWFGFFLCFCCFPAAAEEQYQVNRVRHDPFQKPAIQEKKDIEQTASENSATAQSQTPKLIATMRAGKNSMANVNGKIIKLGQTINGYKLVRVEARRAMFEKNRKYNYLTIDNHANE